MRNSKAYGLPAVDLPPVDFNNVTAKIRSVIGTIQEHDSEERFCTLGARVEFGEPVFIDDHSIQLHGDSYSAKTGLLPQALPRGFPLWRALIKHLL